MCVFAKGSVLVVCNVISEGGYHCCECIPEYVNVRIYASVCSSVCVTEYICVRLSVGACLFLSVSIFKLYARRRDGAKHVDHVNTP